MSNAQSAVRVTQVVPLLVRLHVSKLPPVKSVKPSASVEAPGMINALGW